MSRARRWSLVAAGLAGVLSLTFSGPVLAADPAMPQAAPAAAPSAGSSADPRIKLRDGARLLQDLSNNLEIPRAEICKELGRFDCNDDAFRIVLGGVDAYGYRVFEPQDTVSVGAPIAFDRIALHVCTNRVARDIATPASAILFKPAAGRAATARPDRAWMDRTTVAMYDRLLQRPATSAEKAQMADFYKTVANGRADSADVQKDWVVLGCFAVASSLESVFY